MPAPAGRHKNRYSGDRDMDSKNYTEVLIDGRIYTLGGAEDESYLQRVASYINEKHSQLKKRDGFLKQSGDYQSVMVELNIADDYFKAKEEVDKLKEQKNELEKEAYSHINFPAMKMTIINGGKKLLFIQIISIGSGPKPASPNVNCICSGCHCRRHAFVGAGRSQYFCLFSFHLIPLFPHTFS